MDRIYYGQISGQQAMNHSNATMTAAVQKQFTLVMQLVQPNLFTLLPRLESLLCSSQCLLPRQANAHATLTLTRCSATPIAQANAMPLHAQASAPRHRSSNRIVRSLRRNLAPMITQQ